MTSRAVARVALQRRLAAAVDDVVGTIRDEIPAYAHLTDGQVGEVAAIASWGIDRVLDLWVAQEDLSPADINRFRGIGAARALDGRPLPGVLRAYRLAGRTVLGMVASTAGDALSAADAMALAQLWMTTIDTISEALLAGHSEAGDRLRDDRRQALADLLDDLLAGRQATLTALLDRGRRLDVVIPAPPVVLVVHQVDTRDSPAAALGTMLESVGLADDDAVLRTVRRHRGVVVATAAQVALLASTAHAADLRGCAVAAARAHDIQVAHQLGDLCLDLAPDHAYETRPVLDEGDAQVLAILTGHPLADPARLAPCVLRDSLRPGNDHLIQGLDAFLAYGSSNAAARHLGLHPQTMRYRLRRLQELSGRDPRRGWDRFVLESARRATRG